MIVGMKELVASGIAIIISLFLSAQEPPKKAKTLILKAPAQAALAALSDIQTLPEIERPFTRYIWVPGHEPGSQELKEAVQGTAFTCAVAARGIGPVRPLPLHYGQLLRVNLRKCCRFEELQSYIDAWEELQFDPMFNLIVTKDTVDLISKAFDDSVESPQATVVSGGTFSETEISTPWPGGVWPKDGKRYEPGSFEVTSKKRTWTPGKLTRSRMAMKEAIKSDSNILVIRVNGPHVDPGPYEQLQKECISQAPIVHYGYFTFRALSSIQEDGVYKVIFGGLYYDLAGVRIKGDKGTDEDRLFESLGLGNVKAGLTAQKLFDTLRSDRRVGVFRRKLNGRPSRVDWFPTLATADGQGIVFVTHDVKKKSVDTAQHPIANLEDFKDDAREVIFTRSDGTHGFALFNAEGKLQEKAPEDVAVDRTIPEPHAPSLEAAISCMRCHGKKGLSGWQALHNDVKTLLAKGLKVFGDIGNLNRTNEEAIERVHYRYRGDPENAIRLGRGVYMAAVLRATGPWTGLGAQTDIVEAASNKVGEIYRRYIFDPVGPEQALRELGLPVGDDPAKEFAQWVPFDASLHVTGFFPEDFRIGGLRVGLDVSRYDWSLAYSFAALRSQKTLATRKK